METFNIVKTEPFAFSEFIIDPLKEELRACRVCLCVDRRLYNLHHYKINGLITFADTLAELLGTPVDQSDGLPQHLCSLCAVQFQRCAEFRVRGRRSHQTLLDILQQQHEVTATFLQTVQPTQHTFSLSKPHIEDFIPDNAQPPNLEIKDEKSQQISEINLDANDGLLTLQIDETSPVTAAELANKVVPKVKLKNKVAKRPKRTCKLKKQICVSASDSNDSDWTADVLDEGSSSIKNETQLDPESDYEETKPKRAVGKRKTVKETAKKKKSKRLYNQKDEEDYEEFRRLYNMDFKILTHEEQLQLIEDRKTRRDPPSAQHQCGHCYKWFVHEVAYKRHMPVHDVSSGPHVCEICQYRFPDRPNMLAHKRHHRVRFECQLCPRAFHNCHLAKVHHLWHQGHTFTCRHCQRQFRSESTYLNHVRDQHTVLPCQECGGRVEGSKALQRHMEERHGITPLKKKPRYSYPQAQKLKEQKQKPPKAEARSEAEKAEVERADGEKAEEKKPKVENRFICEVCGKRLPSRAVLVEHHRIHTGEKPYACADCPKTFRTKMLMKIHHNVHTGARPFQCRLCPERFRSYTLRYKHGLMVHVKPQNKCHLCEKTYNIMDDLRAHIRHTHMKVPRPKRVRRNRRKETIV